MLKIPMLHPGWDSGEVQCSQNQTVDSQQLGGICKPRGMGVCQLGQAVCEHQLMAEQFPGHLNMGGLSLCPKM